MLPDSERSQHSATYRRVAGPPPRTHPTGWNIDAYAHPPRRLRRCEVGLDCTSACCTVPPCRVTWA
eukprot:scaffold2527_cov337-Prasinococcus_capsulatus_cf.AAC.3